MRVTPLESHQDLQCKNFRVCRLSYFTDCTRIDSSTTLACNGRIKLPFQYFAKHIALSHSVHHFITKTLHGLNLLLAACDCDSATTCQCNFTWYNLISGRISSIPDIITSFFTDISMFLSHSSTVWRCSLYMFHCLTASARDCWTLFRCSSN